MKLGFATSKISLLKEELLLSVNEHLSSIEPGVQIFDRDFPIPEGGKIDIVASDSRGRILLVNVGMILNANNLAQFFTQHDWVEKNKEVFEHFYPNRTFKKEIRLLFLAQNKSGEIKSLLKRLDKNISLEIFTCECVLLFGERWLVVQRLEREVMLLQGPREVAEFIPSASEGPARKKIHPSELSQAELDDFFVDSDVEKEKRELEEEVTVF